MPIKQSHLFIGVNEHMTEPSNLPDNQTAEADNEISLLDLAIVLAKHKKLILGLPFVTAVLAAGISLLMPNMYTATTKILPPQSQSSVGGMLAQLGGATGLVGALAGGSGPSAIYIAMLKSRTLTDNMNERFGLLKPDGAKYPWQGRKALSQVTTITSGKDGIITIEVDDQDPQLAADLANAYVDELVKFANVLAVTQASRQRLFFERQMIQAKEDLAKAEVLARQSIQRDGLVQVDAQGSTMVATASNLRAQITAKEVQIGVMRTFAADRNPDLYLAKQEVESLRQELAKIEGVGSAKSATNSPSGQGVDSLPLLRNMKLKEVVFELFAKQYEMAKIDEAKDSAVIQVMDKALVPGGKSKPKRAQIVLVSALAALFIAILWAILWEFVRERMAKAKADPEQATLLLDLKRYIAWK